MELLAGLMGSGFLARLTPEIAGDLTSSAPVVHYPAGSVSTPTREVPWAAVVVRGMVRHYLPAGRGRQVTIRYGKPGDLVGSPTKGSQLVRAEVEAVESSDLLHLDVAHVERIALMVPGLALALVEELTDHLQHSYRVLASTAFATVKARVARDLLERAVRVDGPQSDTYLRVTQQALADATGSVREVVARALRDLRLEGAVETGQSGIRILELDALIREAGQTT